MMSAVINHSLAQINRHTADKQPRHDMVFHSASGRRSVSRLAIEGRDPAVPNAPDCSPSLRTRAATRTLDSKADPTTRKNTGPYVTISTSSGKIVKGTLSRWGPASGKIDLRAGPGKRADPNSAQETEVETERNAAAVAAASPENILKEILKGCSLCRTGRTGRDILVASLNKKYLTTREAYNAKIVNDIVYNENTHIVATFKDYLVYDDVTEFMKRFYTSAESATRVPKACDFYCKYTKVFPNYFALPESKFMFKNIERKQRAIDNNQREQAKCKDSGNFDDLLGPDDATSSNRVFTSTFLREMARPVPKKGSENSVSISVSLYQSYAKNIPSFVDQSSIVAPKGDSTMCSKIAGTPFEAMGLEELVARLMAKDRTEIVAAAPASQEKRLSLIKKRSRTDRAKVVSTVARQPQTKALAPISGGYPAPFLAGKSKATSRIGIRSKSIHSIG